MMNAHINTEMFLKGSKHYGNC